MDTRRLLVLILGTEEKQTLIRKVKIALNKAQILLNRLKIVKTLGDGHCLIHAIRGTCIQHPSTNISTLTDSHSIKCAIFNETVTNIERYSPFFIPPEDTHYAIFRSLRRYLTNKEYHNQFGDVVVQIIACALKIHLNILDVDTAGTVHLREITPDLHQYSCPEPVFIYRRSDHFSATVSKYVSSLSSVENRDRRYDTNYLHKFNSKTSKVSRQVRKRLFKLGLWKPGHQPDKRPSGVTWKNLSPVIMCDSLIRTKVSKPGKLCLFNAQSVRNKSDVLADYILQQDIDICSLVETWLKPSDTVVMGILTPPGYKLHTCHQLSRSGGGVAVLHKEGFKSSHISSGKKQSYEFIEMELSNHSTKFKLLVLYRPPYS